MESGSLRYSRSLYFMYLLIKSRVFIKATVTRGLNFIHLLWTYFLDTHGAFNAPLCCRPIYFLAAQILLSLTIAINLLNTWILSVHQANLDYSFQRHFFNSLLFRLKAVFFIRKYFLALFGNFGYICIFRIIL